MMKRILFVSALFVSWSLFAQMYKPIIIPDTSFLPSLLDSTICHSAKGNLKIYDQRVYGYDNRGYLIYDSVYAWDAIGYIEHYTGTYTYNASDKLIERIMYSKLGYRSDLRLIWAYDDKGNQTEEIKYYWNSDINDWERELH